MDTKRIAELFRSLAEEFNSAPQNVAISAATAAADTAPSSAPISDETIVKVRNQQKLLTAGKLKDATVQTLATEAGLNTEGVAAADLSRMLLTLLAIVDGATISNSEATALARNVGLPPTKKLDDKLIGLREFFGIGAEAEPAAEEGDDAEAEADGEEAEEGEEESEAEAEEESEAEGEGEEESEAEGDEPEADEEAAEGDEPAEDDGEEAEAEEVDEDAVVAAHVKATPLSDRKLRIAAYNAAVDEEYHVKKYEDLARAMFNGVEVPEWGTPYYDADDTACCCGLVMEDMQVNGTDACKCVVTGKTYTVDDNNEFVEVVETPKKAGKKPVAKK